MIFVFVLCLSFGMISAQESIAFKNAGNAAIAAKDYAKAFENFEKALAVWGTAAPDFVMIYNSAFCAFQIKNFEKAIKYYDQSIAGNYKSEDALYNKALVYKAQKNNEEYFKMLKDGIAKFPDNTKFKVELGRYYSTEGKTFYNKGAMFLKNAIDKVNSKKFKDINDPAYKAEIEKAKKEFRSAIPSFTKALELNPADANAKSIKEYCENQLKTL